MRWRDPAVADRYAGGGGPPDIGLRRGRARDGACSIHVRRTDKIGSEAQFHHIDEYMGHALAYFSKHHGPDVKPRIYLATDEPNVIDEARRLYVRARCGRGRKGGRLDASRRSPAGWGVAQADMAAGRDEAARVDAWHNTRYPHVEFLTDPGGAQLAANMGSRYSDDSLRSVYIDTILLSRCEYLVCTFSSQVCRLAYEFQQGRYVDATFRVKSLDDPFYYGGGQREILRAFTPYTARVVRRPARARTARGRRCA